MNAQNVQECLGCCSSKIYTLVGRIRNLNERNYRSLTISLTSRVWVNCVFNQVEHMFARRVVPFIIEVVLIRGL